MGVSNLAIAFGPAMLKAYDSSVLEESREAISTENMYVPFNL